MSPKARKRRPRQDAAAIKIASHPSLTAVSDPLDDMAEHVNGAFVVVVESTGDKYLRRCFLSAASAERSASKALAAGHNVRVYLAQLKPLGVLSSDAVAS